MSIQDNNAPKTDLKKFRKLIRKKVVEILTGSTDAGDRVFSNATVPPWQEELPVILVYPRSETVAEYAVAPRELTRNLDLAIEIIATGPESNVDLETPPKSKVTLEDVLDDIAEQVECAMDSDETLGGTCDDSILQNIEFEFEPNGGQPIGSARLTYSVDYNTMVPRVIDKQGGLSDLKKVEAEWNIGDDENTREANDTIDIPTT